MLAEMADSLIKKTFSVIKITSDLEPRKTIATNIPCYIFNDFNSNRNPDGYTITNTSTLYVENVDLIVEINAGYHVVIDNCEYEIIGLQRGSTLVDMNFTNLRLGFVKSYENNR